MTLSALLVAVTLGAADVVGPAKAGHYVQSRLSGDHQTVPPVVSGFSRTVQTSVVSGFSRTAAPKYLSLVTSASATTVKPGAVLSLFVDITPNPGIHVYAPGATNYLPIALTLRPRAAKPLRYPKAELLFFAPLKETVLVYQKPFRLIEDVTIARTAKPGATLTWTGTIDYQACDDKICYVPASAPVSWTVSVR